MFFDSSDELVGFEEAWKGNNMAQLPGFDVHRRGGKYSA